MTDTYGAGRNRITTALMNIQNPPPVSALQMSAQQQSLPPLSQQIPSAQPSPTPGVPGMPQSQPAAVSPAMPALGSMGSIGGPLTPGLNLPGIGNQGTGQPPQGY